MDTHRRGFLAAAAASVPIKAKSKDAYHLRTTDAEIDLSIEFLGSSSFCVPVKGNCTGSYQGQVAIARYRVLPRGARWAELVLREYVRTIDHDARVTARPPFERSIVLKKGVGSDLQAFGYEALKPDHTLEHRRGPWYLYRQDLYLGPRPAPFLIVYWKHALDSIRVLDLIPGDETLVEKR